MGNPQSPKLQSEIPEGARGLADRVRDESISLLNPDYYESKVGKTPDRSVLGYSPYEAQTSDLLRKALAGPVQQSYLSPEATKHLSDVLGGKFLTPDNPALTGVADAVKSQTDRYLAGKLDEIGSSYQIAGGGGGSAAAGAKSRATVDATQRLSETLASLYGGAYESERGRQAQLLPYGLTVTDNPVQRLLQALALGGQERGLAQQQQDVTIENFLRRREGALTPLQLAMQALQSYTGALQRPQYGPSELEQNLGLGFQGANTIANLVSAFKGVGKTGVGKTGVVKTT
jgi:hypothetical protein